MRKRTLLGTIAAAFVLCAGILAYVTPAEAAPLCIATYVDECTVYVCCPEYVPVRPNCKGPKCEMELVWDCWYEQVPDCTYE